MELTDDPLAAIDADELEADIDKAIDELFVKKSEASEPAIVEEAPPEQAVAEPSEEPAPVKAAESEADHLVQLKENLLTLDWEISEENIKSFEKELKGVSDKLSEDRNSNAIIKMALGVLQYLRVAKGSAAPISIQFLHAATHGLDLFGREPAPTDSECNQVMDKLLGQFRRVKAEIQRMKPVAASDVKPAVEPPLSEKPVLEELAEEQPVLLEEPFEEETILEELAEQEPELEVLPEEVPPLEELAEEQPVLLEEPLAEETILEELAEQEPELEVLPEEVPPLEKLAEEQPGWAVPSEEGLAIEPSLEPSATAFAPPEAAPDEIQEFMQQFTQEAREQIRQLVDALDSLGRDTSDFFCRVMRAMADKPALEKVEKHFSTVYRSMEDKLADAKAMSGNLALALTDFEKSVGQQRIKAFDPTAQAQIDSQVEIIQDAVERFTQAAADLRQSLTGRNAPPTPGAETEPTKDIGVDTQEFSVEPEIDLESPEAETLLEPVDEIPPEMPGQTPSPAAEIHLTDVANNTLGIPTEAVAIVFKVSKRMAKRIRQNGYVRLADFKAAFRSIKRGITGPLAALKAKDLNKIQFPIITLSPEILGSDDTQAEAPVKGIVLLTNGESHGALFTDEIMQRTVYEAKGYRRAGLPGEVSGTVIIEGDFEVNLLDPDYLLS